MTLLKDDFQIHVGMSPLMVGILKGHIDAGLIDVADMAAQVFNDVKDYCSNDDYGSLDNIYCHGRDMAFCMEENADRAAQFLKAFNAHAGESAGMPIQAFRGGYTGKSFDDSFAVRLN